MSTSNERLDKYHTGPFRIEEILDRWMSYHHTMRNQRDLGLVHGHIFGQNAAPLPRGTSSVLVLHLFTVLFSKQFQSFHWKIDLNYFFSFWRGICKQLPLILWWWIWCFLTDNRHQIFWKYSNYFLHSVSKPRHEMVLWMECFKVS